MSKTNQEQETSGIVLVTGASGYLATHVVKTFQEAGYKVRGTVRDTKNEQKVAPLKQLCPNAKHPLELVEADLLNEDSWKAAVSGCTYVMHVASPFPMQSPENEMEVIKPAVDGTLNVLRACKEAKTVKKVVLTSSTVAVANSAGGKPGPFTEADWTDENMKGVEAYAKSKKIAEKAAWDFVKELKGDEKFDLIVVNPGFITGPALCGSFGTSIGMFKSLLENKMPAIPLGNCPMVDVRDVALAQLKAITIPEAVGNRHILSSGSMKFVEMANIVHKEFTPQGYTVPTNEAPWKGSGPGPVFMEYENTRMKTVLGIEPRNAQDSIIDMCYNLIETGKATKTSGYKGRK